MPASNFTQYNFLGGEISPWAMGRTELPTYRQSMKLSLNGFPVEEGAWVRRPGFVDCGYTHGGNQAIIRTFVAGDVDTNGVNNIVLFELTSNNTNSWLRFWAPSDNGYPGILCFDAVGTITSFSGANPTVMTMSAAQDTATPTEKRWVTGDYVFIKINTGAGDNGAVVANRQFIVTKLSSTTYSLRDAATGATIDGAILTSYDAASGIARKIIVKDLPYTTFDQVKNVRVLQSGISVLLLSKTVSPWLVTVDNLFTVRSKDADFKEVDGPYLDPEIGLSQTGNKTADATTSDGRSYAVIIGSDGPEGHQFTTDDIGRAFRIWTQPPAWAAGTYALDDGVTYNGNFWQADQDGVTATPGQFQIVSGVAVFPWILTPSLGRWTAAYITDVYDTNSIQVSISFVEPDYPLFSDPVDTWQLGKYGTTQTDSQTVTQFPACGGFLDGRLILGGALQNHVDASEPNQFDGLGNYYHLFSPTDLNGGVFDDNAINEIFQSRDNNEILWMTPDRQGLIFGTENGEWLFGAQTSGDSLTPTSATIRQVSRFKAAFIEPVRVGTALLFVQAAGRKIYEYMVDAFSNRFTGRLLNANAQHLTDEHGGIIDIAYQEDPLPCLWASCADGTLIGCTYRRYSDFATVAPEFNGWHQHVHGKARSFTYLAITSITQGQDTIAAVTYDPDQAKYHVEVMSRIWGPQ